MNMTPLAYQIGNLLLPICLEETRKARELYGKKEDPNLHPDVAEVLNIFKEHAKAGVRREALELLRRLTAVMRPDLKDAIKALKLPSDAKDIMPIYAPYTVIVLEHDYSNHQMLLDVPRIVTHGKDKTTLWLDAEAQNKYNYEANKGDETRVATEEEVEACVMSLTPKQLKFIMTSDLFAPIVNVMFEEQTELVAEENKDKE